MGRTTLRDLRLILSAVQNITHMRCPKTYSPTALPAKHKMLLKAKLRRRQKRKWLPLKSHSTTSHLYFFFLTTSFPNEGRDRGRSGRRDDELHTRSLSLLKVMEVQLKRLGGSQPLCSSQCRTAVPGWTDGGGREGESEAG